ncbi:alkaline phosphatase family protein [Streptomyces cirratus]|uniref:alkaline phosphatase family protein n=1 Tax=Streptomyces cirratus TaxID=68187 RepID=UPI003622D4DF
MRRHSVTYDEAGGFYDHVTPPVPPSPAGGSGSMSTVDVDAGGVVTGEIHQNAPTYPGRRVPMIAVSPWSTGASSAPRPSTTPPPALPRNLVDGDRQAVHGDEHQHLAPRRLRRPDLGVQLLDPRRLAHGDA